jgi:CDP-L-myo-inositol myo-inositolphosphotransferase
VFADAALHDLVRAGEPAVLIDPDPSWGAWDEGCRVRIRGPVAVALGKDIVEPAIDCGAFLLNADVFEAQREAATAEDYTLAGAVSRLAAGRGLRAVPIGTRTWWQDIDTASDLRLARSRLRRSLISDGDGPVSRYLNRPVSTRISMAVAPLRISPDFISVVAAGLALVGAWLLATGQGTLGGIVVQAASVLDGVDGETASLLKRAGPRGAMLDGMLDRVGDAAVIAGLGVWALGAGNTLSPEVVVWLTVAATAGSLLSTASKDRATALGLPPAPERQLGYLLAGRDGRLLIVAVGSILGLPAAALIAVAATSAASLALRLWAIRRRAQRNPITDRAPRVS